MFQPPSGSILLFLAKVIIIKHSVKIRRRGLFGDVATYYVLLCIIWRQYPYLSSKKRKTTSVISLLPASLHKPSLKL